MCIRNTIPSGGLALGRDLALKKPNHIDHRRLFPLRLATIAPPNDRVQTCPHSG